MKKILVFSALILVFLTGCHCTKEYHDGSGEEWIEQQIQNGTLTRQEADALMKQEEDS